MGRGIVEDVYDGTGNISSAPCFVDEPNDPNNYHLGPNSPCIDTGYPDLILDDPNETDIDAEDRIIDGDANGTDIVDMGADEYYWSAADYSGDGLVNFIDYAYFANAWLIDEPEISLDDDSDVDYNDLDLFCQDWLWEGPWKKPYFPCFGSGMLIPCRGGMGMPGGEGFGLYEPVQQIQQAKPEISEDDIEEIIEWLDERWFSGELEGVMSEAEYLDFREAVENSK